MWVNTLNDPAFLASFEGAKEGKVAFLKYGKRSRFVLHDGKITVAELAETIEKIASGEGKFVNIKGGIAELTLAKTK
jgi:hypothetical protein